MSDTERTGLLAEAHRRRVFRTAGLYLVGAWIVLQGADVVFPGFGIPDGAIRGLVWAVFAGFPVALLVGWLYDIGADGIRRTSPRPDGDSLPLRRSDFAILGGCGSFLIALIVGGIVFESPRSAESTGGVASAEMAASEALAVLPFNAESDDERFFAEGIAEEVLDRLQRSSTLPVLGRQSSFAFRDSELGTASVARHLGAGFLVQGSVRRSGDRLMIRAELVDATGVRLWGEFFERAVADLVAVEDEIADAVAGALGVVRTAPRARRRHLGRGHLR